MKKFRRAALAMATLALAAGPAFAFPDRPVQLIVPWAAGGGMDAVMRIFANGLEAELKQPVTVINRTGGGGVTGHTAIATATADGYTIGGASPEISFFKTLGLGDLTPDAMQQVMPLMAEGPNPATGNSVSAVGTEGDDHIFDVTYTGDDGKSATMREWVRHMDGKWKIVKLAKPE